MNQSIILTLTLISLVINIFSQIICITYLGTNKDIITDDWRRKYLIFFAYLNIVLLSFSSIPSYYTVLSIMTSTITLCYLGTSFNVDEKNKINSDDWKKTWLIVMSYINIVLSGILTLGYIGYNLYKIPNLDLSSTQYSNNT